MNDVSGNLGMVMAVVRRGFLVVALLLLAVCILDWLVRTRKINPFSPLARFMRNRVDPLLTPVERRVVRAGGLPSSAPWWALMTVVVVGILFLSLLDFLAGQFSYVAYSVGRGPAGLYHLAVSWVIAILQIAIIVRVVLSWVSFRPGAWYARWSFRLSEPVLGPLRRLIPNIGGMDITPIVAWFGLTLLESLLHRLY